MSSLGGDLTGMHELRQRKAATVEPTPNGDESGLTEKSKESGEKQVYGKTPDGTGALRFPPTTLR